MDDRRIDDHAVVHPKADRLQAATDNLQDAFAQLVLLQQMAEPTNGGFIRRPVLAKIQPQKLPRRMTVMHLAVCGSDRGNQISRKESLNIQRSGFVGRPGPFCFG